MKFDPKELLEWFYIFEMSALVSPGLDEIAIEHYFAGPIQCSSFPYFAQAVTSHFRKKEDEKDTPSS